MTRFFVAKTSRCVLEIMSSRHMELDIDIAEK